MTKDDALRKTKDILHDIVKPHSTKWDMAIVNAAYEKDYKWFIEQLDEVINICIELKETLKGE